ncbi:hypothetical protein AB723_19285, partial [Acinetobacter baumannii]
TMRYQQNEANATINGVSNDYFDVKGLVFKDGQTFDPVSYTHLDVYKRQVLLRLTVTFQIEDRQGNKITEPRTLTAARSYQYDLATVNT